MMSKNKYAAGEMKLQVLLADDHALFRDGMRYVLQQLSEQVYIIWVILQKR
jgi:DNA-binding NarL/FixJ family response regulator